MLPQKNEEQIRVERLKLVISWLPALRGADIYFRAGTYFYCYKRGDNGIVIGTCSKNTVFGKVVSDVFREKWYKYFNNKYTRKRLTKLQTAFDG